MGIKDETDADEHLSEHARVCIAYPWDLNINSEKSRNQVVVNPLLANWPAEDLEAFCGIYTVERKQELQRTNRKVSI